jgi:hypothetical protein
VTALRALAAWPGPALIALVVGAVAVGAAAAPLLVLAVVVAPLLALLQPPRAVARPHPALLVVVATVAALILAAHLSVLGDVAVLLGARRWHGVVAAAALGLLATLAPGAARWRGAAFAAGALTLLIVLVSAASAASLSPWRAWERAAARSALVFGGRSVWVTDGASFLRRATLGFDEGHRVVALAPGTFRVVERDGGDLVVRDWRLAAGDAMTLRPGDTLTAEPGSRLRFEAGKRVPGAAPSGVAWADAGTGGRALATLATVLTLALGALALVPAGDRRALPAVVVATVVGLGAAAWGVYATLAAPEAGLGGSAAEAVLAVARAAALGARVATLLVVLALLALLVAAAGALRDRVTTAGGPAAVWTATMVLAAFASFAPLEPSVPLLAGLGLAGAALAAPRLAAGAAARLGPWPAEVVGGVAGAVAFVAFVVLVMRRAATLDVPVEVPALAAAASAWILVKFLRSEPSDGVVRVGKSGGHQP